MEFERPPDTGLDPMTITLAALGAFMVAAPAWAVARSRTARQPSVRRECDGARQSGVRARLSPWTCAVCGVTACTSTGRPPQECKRALKGKL
jgi:hypothetical protein